MKTLWSRYTTYLILVAALVATYAPFLGTRYIRTGGDEKVYVSQAVEMARDGHWFVQTLEDVPDYYKGPVHYILVRLGAILFGRTPWATLYMNLLFLCVGSVAVAAVVKRRLPDWKGGAVWAGAAFGMGVGIYAHTFASQMEVELASLCAVAFYLLDRVDREDAGWAFWIVAGVVGWIKAPLHSAFMGVSAVLFWILAGQARAKIKNPKAWLVPIAGILVSIAGFLPAFFADRENFVAKYIIKEIYEKSLTGQPASTPIVSTFGFYLWPWMLLAFVAYVQLVFKFVSLVRDVVVRRLLILGFCFCAPSVAFFIWHPYRFENYNLPVISGLIVMIAAVWSKRTAFFQKLYGMALGISALAFLLFAIGVSGLALRFSPLPAWWPAWMLPVIWLGALINFWGFIKYGIIGGGRRPDWLAFSAVGGYWALGAFFAVLGQREMVDLKQYLAESVQQRRNVKLSYVNLQRNSWCEWGLMNFWVDRPVKGLHLPETLKQAILDHDTLLLPNGEANDRFQEFIKKEFPNTKFSYRPWKRWRTHGQTDTGVPLWKDAWDRRSLAPLERDFYIVEVGS